MEIKAIIYDVDGTLANSFPTLYTHWTQLCNENGRKIPFKNEIEARNAHSKFRSVPEFFQYLGFDLEIERELVENHYHQIVGNADIPLFPGIIGIISYFKSKNILQGIATDGTYEKTYKWLDKFPNLKQNFSAIVTTSNGAPHKPDPAMLLEASKLLNISPVQCAYVGDTIKDMIAAKRANMTPIGVTYGNFEQPALLKEYTPYIAKNPFDLIELINKLK